MGSGEGFQATDKPNVDDDVDEAKAQDRRVQSEPGTVEASRRASRAGHSRLQPSGWNAPLFNTSGQGPEKNELLFLLCGP